jgi:putative Mn2+ efflux pump MntP
VGIFQLLVLSMALGTDLFSVAVPIGMSRLNVKIMVKAAVVFALFHILLLLAGYYLGVLLEFYFQSLQPVQHPWFNMHNVASCIGGSVLLLLGIHMLYPKKGGGTICCGKRFLQGKMLLLLAAGVSIDALAVGFGLGMMEINLLHFCAILGSVIFSIAIAGLSLGRQLGRYIGSRAEWAGGSVLILLGMQILWGVAK